MLRIFKSVFPFLDWFKDFSVGSLRTDFVAGLTVALVLIPQSMAYAQLAGLPAYYGLYAAFLPPMVAALFGSSRQLATGPVAVVSLMTAATLEPVATAGSEAYIGYAVGLALVVGLFQLALGLLRLGVIVNFLSHPVVNGFTNAAAIIIASSQLSKLFGVYVDSAEHHYETIWRVVVAAIHFTHWPTLGLAALAFALMYGLKRVNPRLPFVLVAVGATSIIAWATGFEHNTTAPLEALQVRAARDRIAAFNVEVAAIERTGEQRARLGQQLLAIKEEQGVTSAAYLNLAHDKALLDLALDGHKRRGQALRAELRRMHLRGVQQGQQLTFYLDGAVPADSAHDGRLWRLKVGNTPLDLKRLPLTGGGAVVGVVPRGLPSLSLPPIDLKMLLQFLSAAAIISLLGFMEAISIAKAMAAKTRQRLDPNRELIGQGLANVLGSIARSYPVSGSFSRSAVNLGAGAVTGMSSVFTSLVVVTTLLLFTPVLYNIPQSVLAAVIMIAVVGLVNVRGFIHTYRAQRYDGVIAVITFFSTLGFAPHLDRGIMVGVVLSIGHYLYRNSRPGLASLSRHPDLSLRDAERHGLRQCQHIAVVRFEGPLFFANTSYLEDRINERTRAMPELRHLLLVGNGINEIDASGEEALSLMVNQLRERGVEVCFSGLNESTLDLMRRTHLLEKIGEGNIYPTMQLAVRAIHAEAHRGSDEERCPLQEVIYRRDDMFDVGKPVLRRFGILLVGGQSGQAAGGEGDDLGRQLTLRGLKVTDAVDGAHALRILERTPHDVVVVATSMPGPSDEALAAEVFAKWPGTQVVLLAEPGTEAAFRLAKIGVYELLSTPCSVDDLTRAVNRAVYETRTGGGPRPTS